MSAWLGPAVVAAVISALIQVIGWLAAERRDVKADRRRRAERVRDVQVALRAEIRGFLHQAGQPGGDERKAAASAVEERIMQDEGGAFVPFVPKMTAPVVFDAVVREIHVLPVQVIDPVVLFYRQTKILSDMADDLRGDRYGALSSPRRAALYRDFIAVTEQAIRFADQANAILQRSLDEGWVQ